MQDFLVFHRPIDPERIAQYDSFNVLPSNTKEYSIDIITEWQTKMVCYKASNRNPMLKDEYYNNVDYAKVFENYVLSIADKVNE